MVNTTEAQHDNIQHRTCASQGSTRTYKSVVLNCFVGHSNGPVNIAFTVAGTHLQCN